MQITDFMLWAVPKHLLAFFCSLYSCMYVCVYICVCVCVCVCIYIYLLICPLVWHHTFSFFIKISSFVRSDISFQTIGCLFGVPEVYIVSWKPLNCCLFLVYCHMSVGRHSKFLGEMWFQLFTFEILSLFPLQCSVFQNRKQLLGQISIICQLDRVIINSCWCVRKA